MATSREILTEALSNASNGRLDDALRLLEKGIERAITEGDAKRVALVARNAALVSDEAGQPEAAERYYRLAITKDASDSYTHYALGDFCKRQGKTASASEAFGHAFELAKKEGDEDLLRMLEKAGFGPT